MSSARQNILKPSPNDVVIVSATRTAITKSKKGGFKDTHPEELLMHVLKHAYSSVNLDPKLIQDIVVGNVLPPSGGASAARMASLAAGIPDSVPIQTVNRQCSSGLTSVNIIANGILAGDIDVGIGAGVESMTFGYGPSAQAASYSDLVLQNAAAEDCLLPMGITSENVASDYKLPRAVQDEFAALSFQKAAKAQKAGHFEREILPTPAKFTDPKTEKESDIVVKADDGVRDGVTKESLAKLKPAFAKDGSTHAGNASQVSDGAAAVLLARRSVAEKLKLPIRGKFVGAAVVGVPPRIMGVGPAYAVPKVLEKYNLKLSDVDFFEINEAFASQALFSVDKLGLDWKDTSDKAKVNRWGGAIAIGHPLGCTGARQIATGLNIAKTYKEKVFVTSMCIGSGMGMAAVFVSEE